MSEKLDTHLGFKRVLKCEDGWGRPAIVAMWRCRASGITTITPCLRQLNSVSTLISVPAPQPTRQRAQVIPRPAPNQPGIASEFPKMEKSGPPPPTLASPDNPRLSAALQLNCADVR